MPLTKLLLKGTWLLRNGLIAYIPQAKWNLAVKMWRLTKIMTKWIQNINKPIKSHVRNESIGQAVGHSCWTVHFNTINSPWGKLRLLVWEHERKRLTIRGKQKKQFVNSLLSGENILIARISFISNLRGVSGDDLWKMFIICSKAEGGDLR